MRSLGAEGHTLMRLSIKVGSARCDVRIVDCVEEIASEVSNLVIVELSSRVLHIGETSCEVESTVRLDHSADQVHVGTNACGRVT